MSTPTIPVAAPCLDADDIAAAVRVLESGFVQGPEAAAFEDEFADLVDGRHCIAVGSGTSALWLTLLALGTGPGDEVIVPSFTFAATAAAVRLSRTVRLAGVPQQPRQTVTVRRAAPDEGAAFLVQRLTACPSRRGPRRRRAADAAR